MRREERAMHVNEEGEEGINNSASYHKCEWMLSSAILRVGEKEDKCLPNSSLYSITFHQSASAKCAVCFTTE